ncbi:MAG: transglutaminase domain-containing protein [Pseudomonadota bacterium]
MRISYSCAPAGASVLVPGGMTTPHGATKTRIVAGGTARPVTEATTGQTAWLVEGADTLAIAWDVLDTTAPYPDAVFRPKPSRYSRAADALMSEAHEMAGDRADLDAAIAIACGTAERFTYGHPENRFNDGLEEIPALGCGLTEGSCVDINTYFIAALRAVGIEAGYVTGFYIPAEKGDHCEDGHCWVVTRIGGETQEWDVAHHLKMGSRAIRPGLNPKPGWRAACFHSMGLDFPELGLTDVKAVIEPLMLDPLRGFEAPAIRLAA